MLGFGGKGSFRINLWHELDFSGFFSLGCLRLLMVSVVLNLLYIAQNGIHVIIVKLMGYKPRQEVIYDDYLAGWCRNQV